MRIARTRKGISPLAFGLIFLGVACIIVAGLFIAFYWSGRGAPTTETKQFSNFNKLDISAGFQVTISQSDTYSVSITADQNVIDRIQVTQSGGVLTINPQPGFSFSTSTLKADISMPVLNGVVFSGGTRGIALSAATSGPGLTRSFNTTEEFTADLTGGSSFESSDIILRNMHVDLSGASSFNVQGVGGDLVAVISGASNLQMTNFPIHNAQLDISGASHATVDPSGRLDVSASGFSSVTYYGSPTLGNIGTSGGSTVNKG